MTSATALLVTFAALAASRPAPLLAADRDAGPDAPSWRGRAAQRPSAVGPGLSFPQLDFDVDLKLDGLELDRDLDFDLDLDVAPDLEKLDAALDAARLGELHGLRLGPLALLDRALRDEHDEEVGRGGGSRARGDRSRARGDRDEAQDERDDERDDERGDREQRRAGDIAREARERARREVREVRRKQREERQRGREERRRTGRGDATAEAKGESAARLAVKGPVRFQLRSQSGDVVVSGSRSGEVQVTLTDAPRTEVVLYQHGDRVEPEFGTRGTLRRGKLRVELPAGSSVDVQSTSGDVDVQALEGDVRVRTMSGDVKVKGCAGADVQSISGDVRLEGASGPVRLQTVSGDAKVSTASAAPQLQFSSVSGNLEWAGLCARGCRLSTETVSGEVTLALDRRSSFGLSFASHTGELDAGDVKFEHEVKRGPELRRRGVQRGRYEATFGSGEGVIESDAFSGGLHLTTR